MEPSPIPSSFFSDSEWTDVGRDVQDYEAECQVLRSMVAKLKLGATHMRCMQRMGATRVGCMAWSISEHCPYVTLEDARRFASAIDHFEAFETADQLRAGIHDEFLFIWYGNVSEKQWTIRYGIRDLREDDRQGLLAQVNDQIEQQKRLFEGRSVVKNICSSHLAGCPCRADGTSMHAHELKLHLANLEEEVRPEVRRLLKDVVDRFQSLFTEFAAKGLSVDDMLADGWKPLDLQRATWMYAYLKKVARTGCDPSASSSEVNLDDATRDVRTLWNFVETELLPAA